MYVIIVYDVDVERVSKVNKFLKAFLFWRQNSVFEGDVSISQFERVKSGILDIIDKEVDSVLIYKLPTKKNFDLDVLGIEKNPIERIL